MNQLHRVAVLDLGAMGHAFCTNLLKHQFTTFGWNRSKSRGEDLVAFGLQLADNVEDAVKEADVILTMLANGEVTQQVVTSILSTLPEKAIIVQMATIGIETIQQLMTLIARLRPDVSFIDAPVSGTKTPAEQAQITILASGDTACAPRLEPIFNAISKSTRWLGPCGMGSRMKLVVNAWLIAMMQGVAESTSLAAKLGFSPEDFWSVLDGGPLAAPYIKGKLSMIATEDYTPQMQLTHALKDVNLALQAAPETTLPVLQTIATLWQQAVTEGYGEQDLSVIYQYISQDSTSLPEK
ncbi:MAG: 2-(hydroxymethyl)glutarate dehydrogenase [Candidatus Erwinia impunctatus]|nr:2-(hydroxymethyl)glutarate dehydrogenase [Culicoides impunctatus]